MCQNMLFLKFSPKMLLRRRIKDGRIRPYKNGSKYQVHLLFDIWQIPPNILILPKKLIEDDISHV